MIVCFLVLHHLHSYVSGTTLVDYGSHVDNYISMANGNISPTQGYQPRSIEWTFQTSIPIYGQSRNYLKIFETGVVTYQNSDLPLCPNLQVDFSIPYIAAYWVQADLAMGGAVYYRQDRSPGNAYASLVDEINIAQNGLVPPIPPITSADLVSVIVITWDNMRPQPSDFVNVNHRNTFQLVILSTAIRSYVLILYDRIDYYRVFQQPPDCAQAAVVGLKEPISGFYFPLSSIFYLQPYNVLLYTNIHDHSKLRRYILILESRSQPLPISINCSPTAPATPDPYCQTGVPPFFCALRPAGIYPHPSDCQHFVLCGSGGVMDVQSCGSLFYNPQIQNCDWSGYYQCHTHQSAMFSVMRFMPQNYNPLVSIRDEINMFQNVAFHNNTCMGQPVDTILEDVSSCENYLMCSNTRTYRMPCPLYKDRKLFYNRDTKKCDFPRNVNCVNGQRPLQLTGNSSITTTQATTTTTTTTTGSTTGRPFDDNICASVQNYADIPDPQACHLYYSCLNGKALHRWQCQKSWNGEQLYYDPIRNLCDYQTNVICFNGQRPN